MIVTIFITIFAIALILLFVGQYLSAPPLQIGAYVIGFLLGLTLMLGGVSYPNGEVKQNNYACACCGDGGVSFVNLTIGGVCSGTPYDCDYYDGSEVTCVFAGCTYDSILELCSGVPLDCDTELIERDCNSANCTWSNVTSTGCVNGSSLVVLSENKTISYSSFSGEIFFGIELNHIFGLLLSLLSAFGFVIVFMNLKDGLEGY
jgi:hypothetical protein